MSDDYSDPQNMRAPSGDAEPEIANAGLRIAIHARSPQIAEAIWNEIRQRISRKGDFIAVRSQGPDASVAVFHVSVEDLSDDEAVRACFSGIVRSATPLNFLVAPASDIEAQRGMANLLDELSKDKTFLQASVRKQEEDAASPGEQDFLLAQARDIANRLVLNPPLLSTVALAEFVSESNAARRDAKAGRKSKSSGKDEVTTSKTRAAKKASGEEFAGTPAPPTMGENPEEKSARKVAKQSVKAERRSKAKGVAASEGADREKAVEAKAAKRAAKRLEKKAKKDERRKNVAKPETQGAAIATTGEGDSAKVARNAAKQSAKAERRNKKTDVDADVASEVVADADGAAEIGADKAARKAAKQLAKAERRSKKRDIAAGVTPDVVVDAQSAAEIDAAKAARKAAKQSEKAERKSKKSAAVADTTQPTKDNSPEARAAKRAGKKAEKSSKKAERRTAKKAASLPLVTANGSAATVMVSADAAKVARKAQKAALKAERKEKRSEVDASPGEAGAEKTGRRARRKSQDDDGDDTQASRAFRIGLDGLNEASAVKLRRAMELALAGTAIEWPGAGEKSDIAIYAFDDPPMSSVEIVARAATIANDKAKMRVFLARSKSIAQEDNASVAAENRAITTLAGAFEGALIQLDSKIQRYGHEPMLVDGQPGDAAYDLVATSILGRAARKFAKRKIARPTPPPPPDLIAARALAETPGELLSQLTWNDAIAPKLLWTRASKESMDAFLDRKIELSDEQSLDINLPIDWPAECPSRAAEGNIFGLDFLSGPLNYWYSKANGRTSGQVAEVDAVLKGRGATASEVLSYAGKIILDFAEKHPLSASVAWEEHALSRRTRVLALFILCCKMASKRKVKFDEAVCTKVHELLLESIEVLRSDDLYVPCSFEGVEQDCLLTGLALVLRKTDYAERLLGDALARLKTLQLDPGLTAEGVWRVGSFSDHCQVLSQFKILLGDFDSDDAALIEPIAAAAKKMAMFAEAVVKSNGAAPFFDDSRQKSFAKKLSGTRRALAEAGFSKNAPARSKTTIAPRLMETYVFREAQYFISHSMQKVSPESSLVLLHADPASLAQSDPGGVTLAFARGETDFLIRAEPPGKTDKDNRMASFDPGLRNGYHINGSGFSAGLEFKPNAAHLVKSWRGPGWAAAKSIDETNPAGSIARVVIHLKAVHALVVVDELVTANGEDALFEQFWHFAPGLTSQESAEMPLQFSVALGGCLSVAFDTQIPAVIEPEGEGSCLRRSMRLGNGIAATLFQWSDQPALVAVGALQGDPGAWTLAVSGNGFDVQLNLSGDDLRYETQPAVELHGS